MNYTAGKYLLASKLGLLFYGPRVEASSKTSVLRRGQTIIVRSMRLCPIFRGIYGIERKRI